MEECMICLNTNSDFKCDYCTCYLHLDCYKKYGKKECPQCKNIMNDKIYNLILLFKKNKLKNKKLIKILIDFILSNKKEIIISRKYFKLLENILQKLNLVLDTDIIRKPNDWEFVPYLSLNKEYILLQEPSPVIPIGLSYNFLRMMAMQPYIKYQN